ncbi:MAG: DUF115 domain-containing protein [Treponema sp.]|nr:DUF115 domain-containing protein [Treponema sp.]
MKPGADIKYFILIEPGLGYIIPVLRERFPDGKIIALHADPALPGFDVPTFRGNENIQNFLEREIQNCKAAQIRIIEWRPSLMVYGEAYLKLLSETAGFIKRIDAGLKTEKAFGGRWYKNFIRNAASVRYALLYRTMDIPIIYAASGPSLEDAIPVIREYKDSCFLIAASSAIPALAHNGINADLIITTDGGNWALRHLHHCYRDGADNTGIALNLSAALPCQYAETAKLIINDGSLWQSIILHELDIPSVIIPQMGTVSASAAELSLVLTSSNIYIAGMDLAVNDIRSHTRPYGFDEIFWGISSRFLPYYCQTFIRSKSIQEGGSMDIYASWFKNHSNSNRVFSIGGGIFEKANPLIRTTNINKNAFFKTVNVNAEKTDFRKKAVTALFRAFENQQYSGQLKSELSALLFSGAENISINEIRNKITELSNGKK